MLYDELTKHYKETDPIFFSDLERNGMSKSALNQQLQTLCRNNLLVKYDKGVYFIPKKSPFLKNYIGPNADSVAAHRFISKNNKVSGFYSGNTFANQLGISTQVPRIVEITSNNTNSSTRLVTIGGRQFRIKKPVVPVTNENVYTLQLLDILKNLDAYLDYDCMDAKEKIAEYIHMHSITRHDVDLYIRKYPMSVFKHYYEMEIDHVLA